MAVRFLGHKQHAIVDDEVDIDPAWEMATTVMVLNSGLRYLIGVGGSLTNIGDILALSAATPALNTAAQLSTLRNANVFYCIDIQLSSLLLGNAGGTAILEYADDSGITVNVVQVCQGTNSISGVLSLVNTGTVMLSGTIPAGKYRRIRTTSTGTASFTARGSQQVLL